VVYRVSKEPLYGLDDLLFVDVVLDLHVESCHHRVARKLPHVHVAHTHHTLQPRDLYAPHAGMDASSVVISHDIQLFTSKEFLNRNRNRCKEVVPNER
jgi:hypothetical protein